MVEAAGVEPASEKACPEKATCVSGSVIVGRRIRYRQENSGLSRLDSACGFAKQPWTYPAK